MSQAITLIESQKQTDQEKGQAVLNACLPFTGGATRIGITGTPGVGKSSFIEAFGCYLTEQKSKVAVLAIDPSSPLSKGSILGDKTRMERLSRDPLAFIRPSPTAGSLGGVAQKTRETMLLCEAAGYEIILLETVGVGQSEVAVHALSDFFLLLLLPGAGDELQGIKRGIVEMADLIAVNKSDGDRKPLAKRTQQAYRSALHLFPPKPSAWTPPVELCSAIKETGMDTIWKQIQKYQETTKSNGYWPQNRAEQVKYWFRESL
ncbi:MAG: methylmalonyl Co-A mutase-associated GTPase MeaB, partial [Bacteroidota bacterium]